MIVYVERANNLLSFQDMENGLHIKSHTPVSIEKPLSKTHAPEFGLMLDINF
tara:strand:+ start:435 stop:590 length:156 start_codon:yes stop_codon:yes gene_type:complete